MPGMTYTYTPNRPDAVHATTSSTAWRYVATDGSLHASLAALAAAGKTAFPGLDAGMFPMSLMARCENGSGADGSPFYIAFNQAALPADDNEGHLVSGAGQTLTYGGGAVWNVCIRKTVATDEVILQLAY